MILSYLAAAGITLAVPQASGEALKADLTFEPYTDVASIMNIYGGGLGRGIPDRSARYAKQYQTPAMAGKPTFYKLSVGTRDYVAVLGKSKADLKTDDLMWIDWNSDKQFSESELAKALPNSRKATSYEGRMSVYMPTSFEGGIPKVSFVSYGSSYMQVSAAGYMSGILQVGGKAIKVGIVDMDGNGSYGDIQSQSEEAYEVGDALYFDWNGNGKFDSPNYSATTKMSDLEIASFTKVVRLKNKAFYNVEADPDGAWLEFTPFNGPWTTVTIKGGAAESLALSGPDGSIMIDETAKEFKVPALQFEISQLSYGVTDSKGKKWHAQISLYDAKTRKPLKLKSDKENVLVCGAPFKAGIEISSYQKAPKSVAGVQNFSIDLIDAGGHSLSSLNDDKDRTPKAPTMEIKDASGKVVKALKFSYG